LRKKISGHPNLNFVKSVTIKSIPHREPTWRSGRLSLTQLDLLLDEFCYKYLNRKLDRKFAIIKLKKNEQNILEKIEKNCNKYCKIYQTQIPKVNSVAPELKVAVNELISAANITAINFDAVFQGGPTFVPRI